MKTFFSVLIILIATQFDGYASKHFATVSGTFDKTRDGDSVILSASPYGRMYDRPIFGFKVQKSTFVNHHFKFKIPVEGNGLYITLYFPGSKKLNTLDGYYLENADEINVRSFKDKYSFSGNGAVKFQLCYELQEIRHGLISHGPDPSNDFVQMLKLNDSIAVRQYNLLEQKKGRIRQNAYLLMKADVIALVNSSPASIYEWNFSMLNDSLKQHAKTEFKNYHRDLPLGLTETQLFNLNDILSASAFYSGSQVRKFQMDSCICLDRPFILKVCYQYLKSNLSGTFRERVITDYLNFYNHKDISDLLDDAITWVKNREFLSLLELTKSNFSQRSEGFDFAMQDSLNLIHHLSEYKGKVVLIDYWFTGCGACRHLAPYLKQVERHFRGRPVVFVSINADKDRNVWLKSLKEGFYTSGASVNLFSGGTVLNNPFSLHYDVRGCPTLLLFDKAGKIMESPLRPSIDNGQNLSALIEKAML